MDSKKFYSVLPGFSNNPTPGFLICKKLKRKPGKHRSNWRWKGFAPGRWRCSAVMNFLKEFIYYLNNSDSWEKTQIRPPLELLMKKKRSLNIGSRYTENKSTGF